MHSKVSVSLKRRAHAIAEPQFSHMIGARAKGGPAEIVLGSTSVCDVAGDRDGRHEMHSDVAGDRDGRHGVHLDVAGDRYALKSECLA